MPLTSALPRRARVAPRTVLAAVVLGMAAALSVATLSNPWLGQAVHEGIKASLQGMQTVAEMLAERSPGARAEGALVNLKHKKQAALHQRALPKIRGPYAPPTAYEALATPLPGPPVLPPEAPLFATIAGGPPETIPPAAGGTGGGPPLLSDIPPPGGGGGFTPPIVTTSTPEVPTTPVTPLPEPATWAMMILGFALIGSALKRRASEFQHARN